MNDANVLLEFLKMPLGNSDEIFKKFSTLPGAIRRGSALEQFLFMKGKRDDRVLLVAHADTFWDNRLRSNENKPQEIVQEHGVIRNTHGGLGADDWNNEHLVVQDWQHTLDVCRTWLSQPVLPRFNLLLNNEVLTNVLTNGGETPPLQP